MAILIDNLFLTIFCFFIQTYYICVAFFDFATGIKAMQQQAPAICWPALPLGFPYPEAQLRPLGQPAQPQKL